MNYFFALQLSEEARQFIQREVVAFWKPALMDCASWYAPEDYHVTLKFLGDVAEDRQEVLITAAKSIVEEASPLIVTLAPPGSFPSGGSKRIFWMGVSRTREMAEIAWRLDLLCNHLGFKREDRIYTPHITVARYPRHRGSDSAETAPPMTEHSFPFWQATQFVLMRTLPPEERAKDTKARYNLVHTFSLGNKPILDVS